MRPVPILLASSLLAACGGGGGSSPPNPPAGTTLRSLAQGKILIGTAVAASPEWNDDPLHTDPTYARLVAEQYSMLVPENVMKFDRVEPSRGSFNFTNADGVVSFARAHDMIVRGHCLLWHQQSAWLWDQSGNLQPGVNAADLPDILQNHVTTVVSHFKGEVSYWDVVNEAIGDNQPAGLSVEASLRNDAWTRYYPLAAGGKKYQWIEDAFTYAHQADPAVKLFYNEYGDEGLHGWGNKSDYTYALVTQLLADGVPIHGVGLQMHISADGTTSDVYPLNDDFAAELKRFTDLGLEVHVTELDVKLTQSVTDQSLATQKAIYKQLLETALANPGVTAFLTWGLDDGHSWITSGAPLPFDASYDAKPAYYGLQEALQGI